MFPSTAVGHLLCILLTFSFSIAAAAVPPLPVPVLAEDSDPVAISPPDSARRKFDRTSFTGFYNNPDFAPVAALINASQHTLDIEIYEMGDKSVREAIRRAMGERKVVVRIVQDPTPLGGTCDLFARRKKRGRKISADCQDQMLLVREVKKAGGSYVPFEKTNLCGPQSGNSASCFEHGKMVIIDRGQPTLQLALVSTGNFNSSNLCTLKYHPKTCNRDYSYVTRDPEAISGLSEVFAGDLKGERYALDKIAARPALARKITISPFSRPSLIHFIKSAKEKIQVQNQYMKDAELNRALMDAAKRGVHVEMMLASECAFGQPTPSTADKQNKLYKELAEAGVHVRFFTAAMKLNGRRGYLHAKAIVVDGRAAWVGSVNGSAMSLAANREYGIFFNHPTRVAQLSAVMASDQKNPESETAIETLECKKD